MLRSVLVGIPLSSGRRRLCLRIFLVLLGSLLAFGLQGVPHGPVHAQSITQATVTEILGGNQVYIQNRQARVDSVVGFDDNDAALYAQVQQALQQYLKTKQHRP